MNGGNNVLTGTAIRVSEGASITLNQLAGPSRIALVGGTGCGETAMEFTGTLNAFGSATAISCGVQWMRPKQQHSDFHDHLVERQRFRDSNSNLRVGFRLELRLPCRRL